MAAVLGDLPALSDNEAKRLLAAALAALANVKAQGRRSRGAGKASDEAARVKRRPEGWRRERVKGARPSARASSAASASSTKAGCIEVPAKRAAKVLAAAGESRALPEGEGLAEDPWGVRVVKHSATVPRWT